MLAMLAPKVRLIEDWPQSLLDRMTPFYAARPQASGWTGRWQVSSEYYRWKYAENPVRPALGAFAFEGEELVGAATLVFKMVIGDGKSWLAGELGDLQVAPSHRGQGLFRAILQTAVEGGVKAGAELIYCLPNAHAARTMQATGAFEIAPEASFATWLLPLRPIAMLSAKVQMLRNFHFLDGLSQAALAPRRRGAKLRRNYGLPASGDAVGREEMLRIAWPPKDWAYRILRYPVPDAYEGFALEAQGRSNDILLRSAFLHGVPAIIVGRIARDADGAFADALGAVALEARERGCAFAALWAPTSARFVLPLLRHGFIPVQRKHFLVAKQGRNSAIDLARLRIDMLDSDKV